MNAAAALWSRRWFKWLAGGVALLLLLVLLVVFFPWNALREPVNRYVTEKTGREFLITRHLDVKLGRTTRVIMDGVSFANPDWAQDRHFLKAERAEVEVRLWPLLLRREIILPSILLVRPALGLQQEPDGRRTWALGKDSADERNVPSIGALVIDQGTVHYVARHKGADIQAEVAMDGRAPASPGSAQAPVMPLRFKAQGRWQGQPFDAEGRTGDVLVFSGPLQKPFPLEVRATTGGTALQARGTLTNLASLDGINANFQLQGPNLAQLYDVLGVVLPATPPYDVAGQLSRAGETFRVLDLKGKLGRSDIAGEMSFDRSGRLPLLTGQLSSRVLDFVDLAPLIGMDNQRKGTKAKPRSRKAAQAPAVEQQARKPRDPNRKVLPATPLDVSRLKSMNADVRVNAARVVNAQGLPLDRMAVHVKLKDGLLVLDPLNLGVAGGTLSGTVRIDANVQPAAVQARLDARALELNRLLPRTESSRSSFGKIEGQVDLKARGSSVAQMLGSADGNVALLMGQGQISNILLEIAGLDGGEVIKFLMGGDQRVQVRCAATAFSVENGLMTSRAIVLDTSDTVFHGAGQINLANESLDLVVKPQPKDKSILSLRSTLTVGGTFGAPQPGVDATSLAGRIGMAIALAAINPFLALAATIETGPGKDVDCGAILKLAAAPRAEARVEKTAPAVRGAGDQPATPSQQKGVEAGRPASSAAGPRAGSAGTPGKPAAP